MKSSTSTTISHFKSIQNLESLASFIPGILYWKDKQSNYLGLNEFGLKTFGFKSSTEIIGRNDYDLWPKFAEEIIAHDRSVIETGLLLQVEERITQSDGKMIYFSVVKTPLYDDNGEIIGIIGNALDISKQKRRKLEYLEELSSSMPGPIYWKDTRGVYLGMNRFSLEASGLEEFSDFIGKTDYDLWPEFADEIIEHDQEVIQTGKAVQEEGAISLPNGQVRHFMAVKVPLRDDNNDIIGVIGNYIDITAQKEAERLRVENEVHKKLAVEQEKFAKLANKVAHDIRSPLSSLTMIVKDCTQIPEEQRIALREAAISIGDIANHLLQQYQKKESADIIESEERQPVLVSAILLESLTSKRYQYKNLPVQFDSYFEENTQFAFIKIGPSAFKRMLSNLINNAVDALDEQIGKIELQLEANNEWVKVIIQDSGKGMSSELIEKILRKTEVTEGKKSGHGLGLMQVWETLENNHGTLDIDSKLGVGTSMRLTFPRVKAPYWIAEEITLNSNDIVVILDDDPSIHGAWRTKFENILTEHPKITLKHFQGGIEALEFIHSLNADEKKKIFMLSDYELLQQNINGLDVISQSDIDRSILVTSHYADPEVQAKAAKTGTQVLPKQLASEIVIKIHDVALDVEEKVDAVIVDDDRVFLNAFLLFAFNDDEIVDEYHNPEHFLKNVIKYDKDIKIYLDNNYATSKLKGLEIAEKLYEMGYTQITLLSGQVFKDAEIPPYVTLIGKNDIEKLKKP